MKKLLFLLLLALLGGCEAQLCREAKLDIESFKSCKADKQCILTQEAYRKYQWSLGTNDRYRCGHEA